MSITDNWSSDDPTRRTRQNTRLPSFAMRGASTNPSEDKRRSPLLSRTQSALDWRPTDVMSDAPSGATATPCSSVAGPEVNASGVPFGKRWRHKWEVTPSKTAKYIHFPSGDQAADRHDPGGPIGRAPASASNGTRRHGSHPPVLFISTTRIDLRSGEMTE